VIQLDIGYIMLLQLIDNIYATTGIFLNVETRPYIENCCSL